MPRMEILDVSVPIREHMPFWPGNPHVALRRVEAIADGAPANVSELCFGVHTGTHVDGPCHFLEGAPGVESVALEPLVGDALVLDAQDVAKTIDAAVVERLDPPPGTERVLFKTRNSQLWDRDDFSDDFVALDASGAEALLERGAKLVGIDYLSIGDPGAHHALLGAGTVVVEGLDLRAVDPGPYRLVCLPLKIVGSDGGPARALLMR
jgi:arylformamidase